MSLLNILDFVLTHPLNRQHKVAALTRFLAWQCRSRLSAKPQVHEWINGSRFWARRGEAGLTGNIYAGLHEFPDMGFLLHFLRADDLFIDVGANAGSYTILACKAVGAAGVAYEPVASTFERLTANVQLNSIESRVRCVRKGVGDREASLVFTSDNDSTNRVLADSVAGTGSAAVEVTTLDVDLDDAAPALIKIDVEGYETRVLQGASRVLASPSLQCVIMELNGSGHDYGFDEEGILALMAGYGFTTCSYDPFTRKLSLQHGKNVASGNTLFLRNISFVQQRLDTAPAITVNGMTF